LGRGRGEAVKQYKMIKAIRNRQGAIQRDRQGCRLIAAVEKGQTQDAWLILEKDQSLVHYRSNGNKTNDKTASSYHGGIHLHIAASSNGQRGDVGSVVLLLQMGANVNARNDKGETALHLACKHSTFHAVSVLLANGASVNEKNNVGWTALHHVSFYVKGTSKIDKPTSTSRNLRSVGVDLVHVLMDHRAQTNSQTNIGWTSLHWAASKGNIEIKYALMNRGADLSITNNKGKTPCQIANHGIKAQQLKKYSLALMSKSTAAAITETMKLSIPLTMPFENPTEEAEEKKDDYDLEHEKHQHDGALKKKNWKPLQLRGII
jgi:hypothetical protein